nr:MAG TPA: hypothetical protein [Caudoviricetes sp.]DAL20060.1 MAG TPA_asm: hypothetical protein [Caudoviricetes sp.]DAZ05636.1 MAG TPA: hypothetical protein [Caudoviricetes sp.]DAZ74801.1 MAG TPA: hypothetical protein [Caudoviricetes sp.]
MPNKESFRMKINMNKMSLNLNATNTYCLTITTTSY